MLFYLDFLYTFLQKLLFCAEQIFKLVKNYHFLNKLKQNIHFFKKYKIQLQIKIFVYSIIKSEFNCSCVKKYCFCILFATFLFKIKHIALYYTVLHV